MTTELLVRRARPGESDAVAALVRRSREAAMPYLPQLHTPDEDRAFFRDRVFPATETWVAERNAALVGFCAFRPGWLEHLYVDPAHRRGGIGTALLAKALAAKAQLRLWVFQRNAGARAFYESHGFRCIRTTAGDNEEHEPDALYELNAFPDPER
ncbi:MAG TPA: GNAT family N-acetyltransferase [Candidatus Elarobacter sp.]|jgi:GNAT superfamily N-acetyltransferase